MTSNNWQAINHSSLQRQRGASALIWLIFIILLVVNGLVAVKLFPVYLNSYTVKTIVEDVAADPKSNTRNPNTVWSLIAKRLNINGINSVTKKHFKLTHEKGGKSIISIDYEVREHMFHNIDAVVTVSRSAEIKKVNDNP